MTNSLAMKDFPERHPPPSEEELKRCTRIGCTHADAETKRVFLTLCDGSRVQKVELFQVRRCSRHQTKDVEDYLPTRWTRLVAGFRAVSGGVLPHREWTSLFYLEDGDDPAEIPVFLRK